MKVLSLGAGVNSTAMLLQFHENIDAVLFADTGAERPETYKYLETYLIPFCEKQSIPFTKVMSKEGMLQNYCIKYHIIPLRMYRWCTDRFKRKPMEKWAKETYGNTEIEWLIGIDYGELHRMRTSGRKNMTYCYPLVDAHIDRAGCERIITEHDFPIPIKSGCYFCPFQRKDQWLNLLKEHPNLYSRAIALEKQGKSYPKKGGILFTVPLERMRQGILNQKSFDDFPNEPPCGGWCMT